MKPLLVENAPFSFLHRLCLLVCLALSAGHAGAQDQAPDQPPAQGQTPGQRFARPPVHIKGARLPPIGFARPPLYAVGPEPAASASPPYGAFTPAMIGTFYGHPYSTGAGTTIAIVDAYDNPRAQADLQTFSNQFGLPAMPNCIMSGSTPVLSGGCFAKIPGAGANLPPSDQGWALEIALDIQWAHAIAPRANIVLIEAASNSFNDLLAAVDRAVALGANVVSMSWGGLEFSTEVALDSHFCNKNAVFFASSGDSGHGAEYPAASSCVIGVGGTTATVASGGGYGGETAWSGGGGGISSYERLPAAQAQSPYVGYRWGNMRVTPDVSYVGDPNTGFAVLDTFGYAGQSGWFQLGGTSAGAPQWAALFAASLRSTWSGNLNLIYRAANAYGSNFHDIVAGSNGTCGNLCAAAPGFDPVTGLGSPRSTTVTTYLHSY